MQKLKKKMETFYKDFLMRCNSVRIRLTKSLGEVLNTFRLLWLTIHAQRYCLTLSLGNRPARLLYGQHNGELERLIMRITIVEYINRYGLSIQAQEEQRKKRRIVELYLQSVIENRSSLRLMAENLMKELEEGEPIEWGKQKAILSKGLGIAISNEVTIEEWRGYIKLFEML